MFYAFLKWYARLAIRIYCRRIVVQRPQWLQARGPLLLAANHPNSFLDGVILTTLFDQRVYSLARGDAFRNRRINLLLRWLHLLPVYRTSEGMENLEHNYTTFAACRKTFEAGGVVLIFSEGRCENEWHLRPLKKGTARLAITSWESGIPLQVVPMAFNYSSFKNFGKEIHLSFGTPIDRNRVLAGDTEGKRLRSFNEQLRGELEQLVYEIEPGDAAAIAARFPVRRGPRFFLLLLPAFAGWLLHAPLFYPAKWFSQARFRNSGHYDSVLTSLLLLAYPFYLLLSLLLALHFFSIYGWLALPLLPFTAWACVQVKAMND